MGLVEGIEELVQMDNPTVEIVECAYHMGYFEEAAAAAEKVAVSGTALTRMVALCLGVYAYLAMGDAAACNKTLNLAVEACQEGVSQPDPFLHNMAIVCVRMLEDATSLEFEGSPKWNGALEDMPRGLQAYCGFQMAYRMLLRGNDQQAIGMVRAFQALAGSRYPVSYVKLRLVAASAYLRLGYPEEATEEFDEAWRVAEPLGIVGPFVEMNPCLPGLARHCLHGKDEAMYKALRAMICRHREGWHELRRRRRYPVQGQNLSALEYSTTALVAWGWTNREIANYMGISENTVKHYLTNAYQKLGLKNRSQIIQAFSKGGVRPE
ncbi:MAG: LuxR C-terminal-related transcriptional regulator [Coriobacteriia bacterium]|nr:LuxR C-terminal-related transcriptional regulator [Coriobacteriia bacterium]